MLLHRRDMLLHRSGLVMSVICVYRELGHLVDGGRCETRATNSKLRQKKKEKRVMTSF